MNKRMKNMDFEEFCKHVLNAEIVLYTFKEGEKKDSYYRDDNPFEPLDGRKHYFGKGKNKKPDEVPPDEWYLMKDWHSGGVGGGSCWDTGESEHHEIEGEPEPEFDAFDTLLTGVWPSITFLEYKRLMKLIKVENFDYNINEYYGNSSSHSVRAIKIKEIYESMMSFNCA